MVLFNVRVYINIYTLNQSDGITNPETIVENILPKAVGKIYLKPISIVYIYKLWQHENTLFLMSAFFKI
jgi:hypothetical protein